MCNSMASSTTKLDDNIENVLKRFDMSVLITQIKSLFNNVPFRDSICGYASNYGNLNRGGLLSST
jgi:hypothetical protein